MIRKKGFTLVELLSVIVILSIILIIAIPRVGNLNEASKKDLFFSLAKNIVRELDYENIETSSSLYGILDSLDVDVANDQVDLEKSKIIITEDGVVLNIFGKDKYDGLILCSVSSSTKSANYDDTSCYKGVYNIIVTLDANGGDVETTKLNLTSGNEYGTLPTPSKQYNIFLGWYLNDTKIESNTIIKNVVDHTLVAQWKKEKSELVVDLDGGTANDKSNIYDVNQTVTLNIPTKDGYDFQGWQLVSGNSIISGNNVTIGTTKTVIKALWVKKVNLTLNLNGGSTTYNASGLYSRNETITLTKPTKTGYNFSNWQLVSGDSVVNGDNITFGTTDTTLNAIYTAKVYTITYNLDGGTLSSSSKTISYNSTYGNLPTPTKAGFTFSGWYTSASGGTKISSSTAYTLTSNQTLYARWTYSSITYNVLSQSYKCANGSAGSTYAFTYSGNCTIVNDGNDNWKIKLTSGGTAQFALDTSIDLFVVGGGALNYSGIAATYKKVTAAKSVNYAVSIGSGTSTTTANASYFGSNSTYYAPGGGTTMSSVTLTGSGKGSNYYCEEKCPDFDCWYPYTSCTAATQGNSYGNSGQLSLSTTTFPKWAGQTTCEFNEGTKDGCTKGDTYAYSPGKGGSGNGSASDGALGKGLSGNNSGAPSKSGIVIIRNAR